MAEGDMMIIAVDFDGCICSYKDGWQGVDKFGPLIPDAVKVLRRLKKEGHIIIINTCRVPTNTFIDFLVDNNIPFDSINTEHELNRYEIEYCEKLGINVKAIKRKVSADVYIDDRGITFEGDWEGTYFKIKTFKPWEMREHKIICPLTTEERDRLREGWALQREPCFSCQDVNDWDGSCMNGVVDSHKGPLPINCPKLQNDNLLNIHTTNITDQAKLITEIFKTLKGINEDIAHFEVTEPDDDYIFLYEGRAEAERDLEHEMSVLDGMLKEIDGK